MSKIVDLRNDDGYFVVLGKAVVLPSSNDDGSLSPMNGSIRFNPVSSSLQLFFDGDWIDVGTTGSGGISGVSITQFNTALALKANSIHNHDINEITGLQTLVNSKAPLSHGHNINEIPTLDTTLATIQTTLAGKAPTAHTHTMANIDGLIVALTAKAGLTHTHTTAHITGLDALLNQLKTKPISFNIPGNPASDYMFSWTCGETMMFLDNFSGSVGNVINPPTSPYAITIYQGGINIGSIAISTTGVFTFSTLFNEVYINKGEVLIFECPTNTYAVNGISFTLVGQ